MDDETSDEGLLSHKDRKLRLLYEPLTLLHALGEARGDRIKANHSGSEDASFSSRHKSQRTIVDAIAYICAYRKGPEYVTAVALERTPEEILVVLAANKDIEGVVVEFLQRILRIVRYLVGQPTIRLSDDAGKRAQAYLTTQVLQFNRPKIFAYYQSTTKAVPDLLGKLTDEEREEPLVARFREWVAKTLSNDGVQLQEADMKDLAVQCYNDRSEFDVLKMMATNPGLTTASERLYKLLAKLGKHVSMSKRLMEATMVLRSELSATLQIVTVPASKERRIPLVSKKYHIEGISNRMFGESSKKASFLKRLETIHPPGDLNRVLAQMHLLKKTKVHAELLIVDHFEQTGGNFLDNNDKYIGCSKPACYLCYLYICHHPRGFARPASHQKLYVGWRLPDIWEQQQNAATRFKNQEGILRKMTEAVRTNLDHDIANRTGKRPPYPDSTAGGISTVIPLESELTASMGDLSIDEFLQQIDQPTESTAVPAYSIHTPPSVLPPQPPDLSPPISASPSSNYSLQPGSGDESSDDEGGVRLE